MTEERQLAEDVRHVIRQSSGCGRTYFDDKGNLHDEPQRYLVRIWCDCGWTTIEDVETISAIWRAHSDGEA